MYKYFTIVEKFEFSIFFYIGESVTKLSVKDSRESDLKKTNKFKIREKLYKKSVILNF